MNYLNLSEQTLSILSWITISIMWIDICISYLTQRGRPDSIGKINLGLVLKHIVVVGYLLQGSFIFAAIWIGIIMLTIYTRSLAKRNEILRYKLKAIRAEINEKVIAQVSSDFDLDPKDFSIEEIDETGANVMYKGEVFDASKYERKKDSI